MENHQTISERQRGIVTLIEQKGYLSVGELAGIFKLSVHTVRRDLNELAELGVIKRVRGGAVATRQKADETALEQSEEKMLIGRAAAQLVLPGETVCIDAGSTTLEVAKQLPDEGIGVLTNSVGIAYELARREARIDITLTGGSVLQGYGERFGLSGPTTVSNLEQVGRVSKTIIGALGIEPQSGVTDRYHYLAEVKRKMVEIAECVILVVESHKIGKRHLESVCGVSEVDVLVTDDHITDDETHWLTRSGIDVIIAPR